MPSHTLAAGRAGGRPGWGRVQWCPHRARCHHGQRQPGIRLRGVVSLLHLQGVAGSPLWPPLPCPAGLSSQLLRFIPCPLGPVRGRPGPLRADSTPRSSRWAGHSPWRCCPGPSLSAFFPDARLVLGDLGRPSQGDVGASGRSREVALPFDEPPPSRGGHLQMSGALPHASPAAICGQAGGVTDGRDLHR